MGILYLRESVVPRFFRKRVEQSRSAGSIVTLWLDVTTSVEMKPLALPENSQAKTESEKTNETLFYSLWFL